MKLLLIALLIPLIGMGQTKIDSVNVLILPGGTIVHNATNVIIWGDSVSYDKPVYDTTRCIILYSDTTKQINPNWLSAQIVYWQFGYEVWRAATAQELRTSGSIYYPVRKEYLDSNKKPLNKNIVVWQSLTTPPGRSGKE